MLVAHYYSAKWCAPCRTFGPALQRVMDEFSIDIVKHDADEDMGDYGVDKVLSIPTVHIKDADGVTVDRIVGAYPEGLLRDRVAKVVSKFG